MGLYISGLEMPKNGSCIQIVIDDDGKVYPSVEKCILKMSSIAKAVPIPPHGDLIDKDEYRDEFMNGVYALCNDDSDNYRANAIIDLFDQAPTVLEAEEGET